MQKGEIYIVSTGTGNLGQLTSNALKALEKSELIVGYKKYIEDIFELIQNKEIQASGMKQEVDRCKYVIEEALKLKKVALICNGDANIYGLAGLVLEIIEQNQLWDKLDIHIEPGITSLLSAASKIGAPITNDFAVVSLSNLLTPLESIKLRLTKALEGDFVLGIYNPLSFSRNEPYLNFLEILKQHKTEQTPVIIAQNLGRSDEKILIKTVKDLLEIKDNLEVVNMSSMLIIGNSSTKTVNSGKNIVTLRGYQQNYDYSLKND